MVTVKKYLFPTMLCLLFIIFCPGFLPAEEAAGKGTSAPSLSIKGSNAQIAPAAAPSARQDEQTGKKGNPTGGAQPCLTIDALNFNAGELWEGGDIIHTFTVRNTGTAQLDITNVKAG